MMDWLVTSFFRQATRLAYMTEEAEEGKNALEKREPNWKSSNAHLLSQKQSSLVVLLPSKHIFHFRKETLFLFGLIGNSEVIISLQTLNSCSLFIGQFFWNVHVQPNILVPLPNDSVQLFLCLAFIFQVAYLFLCVI